MPLSQAAPGPLERRSSPRGSSGQHVADKDRIGADHRAYDRLLFVYEKDTGKLYYDKDGAGGAAAVHFATLAPKLALTFQDIEVF